MLNIYLQRDINMYKIDNNMENNSKKYPKGRKSLAIDVDTYEMLQAICNSERRTKIDQLKLLIEREHSKINQEENQLTAVS
jgi:hypothetical protein